MFVEDQAKGTWLLQMLGSPNTPPEDMLCCLFQNNVVVSANTQLSDLQECSFTGYARVSIPKGSWSLPAIANHTATTTTSANVSFTITGGSQQNTYGWYLLGATSGALYAYSNWASGGGHLLNPSSSPTQSITPFQIQLTDL